MVIDPDAGRSVTRPAPGLTVDCHDDFSVEHRPIRGYETVDVRFMLEDFFAKLRLFHDGRP